MKLGVRPATGDSMAKSAAYRASTRMGGIGEAWAVLRRRLVEALAFALLLASLLLLLMLLTYDGRDASLDTAVDAPPHNFLGHDGAVLADVLCQSLGLACFLIPTLLLAWSFRLLLNRPLRAIWRRLALMPVILVLGALALSVLYKLCACRLEGLKIDQGWHRNLDPFLSRRTHTLGDTGQGSGVAPD